MAHIYNVSASKLQKIYDRLLQVSRLPEPGQKAVEFFPEEISESDLVNRGRLGGVFIEVSDAQGRSVQLSDDHWLRGSYAICRFYDKISDGHLDGHIESSQVPAMIPIETDDVVQSWLPIKDLLYDISSSVVTINSFNKKGSGLVLSVLPNPWQGGYDAYVLTNRHVIAGALTALGATCCPVTGDAIKIKGYVTDFFGRMNIFDEATVLAQFGGVDIALFVIHIEEPFLKAAVVDDVLSAEQASGRQVLVFGTPLGRRSYAMGTIVDLAAPLNPLDEVPSPDPALGMFQVDVAMNPGHSGGGVFDLGRHTLLAINSSKSTGVEVDGIGWAYPVFPFMGVTKQIIDLHQMFLARGFELFDSFEEFEQKMLQNRECSLAEQMSDCSKVNESLSREAMAAQDHRDMRAYLFFNDARVRDMFTAEELAVPPFATPKP